MNISDIYNNGLMSQMAYADRLNGAKDGDAFRNRLVEELSDRGVTQSHS
jgi:hypothetical protein